MAYLLLVISIAGELCGTSLLKASKGFTKLYPTLGTFVAFLISFYCWSLVLKTLPLNITYAIWSGLGSVATALISSTRRTIVQLHSLPAGFGRLFS